MSASRYRDFIWRPAIACLTGGSLRITPRTAAMARWLKRTRSQILEKKSVMRQRLRDSASKKEGGLIFV